MDRSKGKDEGEKVRFFLQAVRGTETGLRATMNVKHKNSYQITISALKSFQRHLELFQSATGTKDDERMVISQGDHYGPKKQRKNRKLATRSSQYKVITAETDDPSTDTTIRTITTVKY